MSYTVTLSLSSKEITYGTGAIGVSDGMNSVDMGVSVTLVVGVGEITVGTVVGVPVGTIMTVGVAIITGLVGDAMGNPVGNNVAVTTGAFVEIGGRLYSICNSGAPAWSTSYASATRLPVPVMIITIELPAAQPC